MSRVGRLALPLRSPPDREWFYAAPHTPNFWMLSNQEFRVGQRVSFADQSLKRRRRNRVRINQRTATVHCDGRAWRVAFALLQQTVDVTS